LVTEGIPSPIVRLFQPPRTELDGIPVETVCLFGLMQLKEDGLTVVAIP
jgi:hypothetical protein